MKRCPHCKTEKPFEAFGKDASRPLGLAPYCRECSRARGKVAVAKWRSAPGKKEQAAAKMAAKRSDPTYQEQERAKARAAYQENADAMRKRKREWQAANPDAVRRYRQENPQVMREVKARYRAALLQAMPPWVDREAIRQIFKLAKLESDKRGETLHVDHIVPLQGESVCGLHVPWNLQILTGFENRSKRNRMPMELPN